MKNIVTILAVMAAATAAASAQANVQITEIMYTGLYGEFVEITNIGNAAQSMTGWKFSDDRRGLSLTSVSTATDISGIGAGSLAAGASAIITEVSSAIFIQAWYTEPSKTALPANRIVANNAINLGRTDEVNIYPNGASDKDNDQQDRITYFDGNPNNHPRSEDVSVVPKLNDTTKPWSTSSLPNWQLSVAGTGAAWKAGVQGNSSVSPGNAIPGPVGSPGVWPNL